MKWGTNFRKDGPKRGRYTRRELPYGQKRMWGATIGNRKREREAAQLRAAGHDDVSLARARSR